MSNQDWQAFFRRTLLDSSTANILRQRVQHWEDDEHQRQVREGRSLINFGSNDYLGLRRDPRLIAAVAVALSSMGVGSGASPLVCGYSLAMAELEQRIAAWQGTESALVFSSGYAMNVGVLAALASTEDLLLSDRLNHASLIDGCRLSGAHKRVYNHGDTQAVEKLLREERSKYCRALVVTESVFSMDGDLAPLEELLDLCERYDAGLIVDEAHATGLYGATGAGLGEEGHFSGRWLAKLGTLGKSLGTCGGFVAGSHELIEYLVNFCRSYLYSTAMAPTTVAATIAAIELMPSLGDARERVHRSSQYIRSELRATGWDVPEGRSPIVPVHLGSSERAIATSRQLAEAGCYVPAIRPPTVPPNRARLRISLSAAHSDDHLQQLLAACALC